MPSVLHLDLDAFFASVEEALHPELRGKPLIVGGMPNERGIVSCPNYEARKLGVRTAMPLVRAARLAPKANFVRGDFAQYRAYSERFFAILNDFSPVVAPLGLDEGFLDAHGCLHFWNGSVETMARAIKERVRRELGLIVSIGAASNTLCAKVASDARKPDGLCIVPDGGEREFLAPMPVGAIPGVGKATTEALAGLGVSTVRDLAQFEESLLRRVFGVTGSFLYHAARGEGHGLAPPEERDAKSISRDHTFREDLDDVALVRGSLFRSCERVAATLRRDGMAARTVTVKLRYSDMATVQRGRTLDEATDSEFALFACAESLLEIAWSRRARVRLVGVHVSNLQAARAQFDLFNTRHTKELLLGRSLDKIRGKFGEKAVWWGIVVR